MLLYLLGPHLLTTDCLHNMYKCFMRLKAKNTFQSIVYKCQPVLPTLPAPYRSCCAALLYTQIDTRDTRVDIAIWNGAWLLLRCSTKQTVPNWQIYNVTEEEYNTIESYK